MAMTWKDIVAEAKKGIALLQPAEVKTRLDQPSEVILIDVREKEEFDQGHLPKSFHVARGVLEMTLEKNLRDTQREIILYCAGGGRSAVAAQALKRMGYQNVASMEGGFEGWKRSGYPTEG